jgi:hypothetical protein
MPPTYVASRSLADGLQLTPRMLRVKNHEHWIQVPVPVHGHAGAARWHRSVPDCHGRNHRNDKWQLSGARPTCFTTIRVDSDDGPGMEVDVEDDLNAERAVPDPGSGSMKISPKHSLEFGYQFCPSERRARLGTDDRIRRDL